MGAVHGCVWHAALSKRNESHRSSSSCNHGCFSAARLSLRRSRQVARSLDTPHQPAEMLLSSSGPLERGPVTPENGTTNARRPTSLGQTAHWPRGFDGSMPLARALGAAKGSLLEPPETQGRARRSRRAARSRNNKQQWDRGGAAPNKQAKDGHRKKNGPDGQALPLQCQL